MATPEHTDARLRELIELLEQRLRVVGDTAWRDRDSEGHLSELARVSESIAAFHRENRDWIPPRLNHFLENSSLQKALEWAQAEIA